MLIKCCIVALILAIYTVVGIQRAPEIVRDLKQCNGPLGQWSQITINNNTQPVKLCKQLSFCLKIYHQ